MRVRGLLKEFWKRLEEGETSEERLALFLEYADVCVWRAPEHIRRQMRKNFYSSPFHDRVCVICWRLPNHWHHIIQLQHGGINHSLNLAAVCKRCHAEIHPWLKTSLAS